MDVISSARTHVYMSESVGHNAVELLVSVLSLFLGGAALTRSALWEGMDVSRELHSPGVLCGKVWTLVGSCTHQEWSVGRYDVSRELHSPGVICGKVWTLVGSCTHQE